MLSINHDRVPLLKPTRFLVNWGTGTEFSTVQRCKVLNDPSAVRLASNKINTFSAWADNNVPCPEWTTDSSIARSWLEDGKTVFARTTVQGHSGNGIVILTGDDFVDAPLYTQYIKKKKEFRVHVFNDKVIDVQEKRRAMGSDAGFLVRNHTNGFVFCRDDIIEPPDLRAVATHAVRTLGLDFGAVDVIWNEHYKRCYALEVNTAPGLEGTTLQSYVNNIMEVAYG